MIPQANLLADTFFSASYRGGAAKTWEKLFVSIFASALRRVTPPAPPATAPRIRQTAQAALAAAVRGTNAAGQLKWRALARQAALRGSPLSQWP